MTPTTRWASIAPLRAIAEHLGVPYTTAAAMQCRPKPKPRNRPAAPVELGRLPARCLPKEVA